MECTNSAVSNYVYASHTRSEAEAMCAKLDSPKKLPVRRIIPSNCSPLVPIAFSRALQKLDVQYHFDAPHLSTAARGTRADDGTCSQRIIAHCIDYTMLAASLYVPVCAWGSSAYS